MSSYVPVQKPANLEVSEATRIPEKIKESAPLFKSYLNPLFELRLRETPCKALAPHINNVVIAKTSDTVSQVFKSLISYQIQAVPLLDIDSNKFIGFIDMLDIFAWLVNKGNLPTDPELFKGDWRTRIQAFEGTTCGSLLEQPRKHPWFTLDRDTSLFHAIKFMAEHHAHRIALVDKNGNFSSLLTQHRVVSWLSNIDLDWYGEFGLLTMAHLEFANKTVVTVPASYTLSDAFVVMWINKLGSIGMTRASGGLMGVLSVSDLKDLGETAQMYEKLFMSCETFISRKVEGGGLPPLIFATPSSSFKEVLGQFKANLIHRVYIAEKSTHMPLGVISCSDVLNLISAVLEAGRYVSVVLPGVPQEFGGEGVAIMTTTEVFHM